MIESYTFGRMVIDGSVYTSDIIISSSLIDSSWWRKSGHKLYLKDIESILSDKFEVFIIGTGFLGLMKVEQEVKEYFQKQGILLIIENTKKAVLHYNKFSLKKNTAGAFHLTC